MSDIFKLSPNSVNGDSISSLKSQIEGVINQVNSVNISDGEFDFEGAKSAIINNLESCGIVIDNTTNFIDQVVNSHSLLQNAVASKVDNNSSTDDNSGGSGPKTNGNGNYPRTSGNGNYTGSSGDGSYTGTSGNGSYTGTSSKISGNGKRKTGASAYSGDAGTGDVDLQKSALADRASAMMKKSSANPISDSEEDVVEQVSTISGSLATFGAAAKDCDVTEGAIHYRDGVLMNAVEHIDCVANEDISFDNNTFNNVKYDANGYAIKMTVTYDDNGYAKVGDNFVVSCDNTLGNLGDTITIVKDDGSSISCIIGNVTNSSELKNDFNFVVNSNVWDKENTDNISNGLLESTSNILVEN